MIDCHAHLASPEFEKDLDLVLERARQAGVDQVLAVGEDHADNERVLALARRVPGIRACLGLHPDRWGDDRTVDPGEIERVIEQIRAHRDEIVAVGEVGLDGWYARDHARQEAQAVALRRLVRLAVELDLPLNVHSRSAGRRTLELLREEGARRVLMHAFDGKAHLAEAAAKEGYLFSIPPSVVRSAQKQKLAARLPLAAMALESDSPVLGPVPGERNEPGNMRRAAEWIATARGVPVAEVIEVTRRSAVSLFRLG